MYVGMARGDCKRRSACAKWLRRDHLRQAGSPSRRRGAAKAGAGEGDRTLVLSLENSCSTIELHPLGSWEYQKSGPRKSILLQRGNGGRGRTRTYEAVKQGIYSPPPLPLGTLSPDFRTASQQKLRKAWRCMPFTSMSVKREDGAKAHAFRESHLASEIG